MMYDVIIIGAGSAGYPAGMYASRYNLKNLIIGTLPGGALSTSHQVENYPGTLSDSGGNIMKSFKLQAETAGSEIIQDEVISIVKLDDYNFRVNTASGKEFNSKTVLIATGSDYKKLGVKGEKELTGAGVSYCATCDGMFFRNREIIMVGGGDSAVTEALYLAELCKKVTLIHRGDKLKAENIWIEKVLAKDNIEIIYNTKIEEIQGKFNIENVILKNNISNRTSSMVTDGIFIAVGSEPNTAILKTSFGDFLKYDNQGYIEVNNRQETSIQGLYAAGDVTTNSNKFKQTIMSAAEGCLAANSIHQDLVKLH